ncbi:MAG: hypothetical protein KJZ86_09825 [Caldilineaceae bacterium]|nr:hypothetical protein [Caldilineaceae bacterium]
MKRLPTWREMHPDTTPEEEEILFAFYRSAPTWKKMEIMSELNRAARTLAMSELRTRHPDASELELRYLFAELMYGTEIAEKIRAYDSAASHLENEESGSSGGNG